MYFFPEVRSVAPADDVAAHDVIHEIKAMLRRALARVLR